MYILADVLFVTFVSRKALRCVNSCSRPYSRSVLEIFSDFRALSIEFFGCAFTSSHPHLLSFGGVMLTLWPLFCSLPLFSDDAEIFRWRFPFFAADDDVVFATGVSGLTKRWDACVTRVAIFSVNQSSLSTKYSKNDQQQLIEPKTKYKRNHRLTRFSSDEERTKREEEVVFRSEPKVTNKACVWLTLSVCCDWKKMPLCFMHARMVNCSCTLSMTSTKRNSTTKRRRYNRPLLLSLVPCCWLMRHACVSNLLWLFSLSRINKQCCWVMRHTTRMCTTTTIWKSPVVIDFYDCLQQRAMRKLCSREQTRLLFFWET